MPTMQISNTTITFSELTKNRSKQARLKDELWTAASYINLIWHQFVLNPLKLYEQYLHILRTQNKFYNVQFYTFSNFPVFRYIVNL